MQRFPVLILFIFLLFPYSALAGNFEISPFVGEYFFDDDVNLKNRPVLGLRLGYGLSDQIGLEVAAEYINTRVTDPAKLSIGRPPFGSPDRGVKLFLYHLDAVYYFLPYARISPFVAAGGGGANFNPSSTGTANRFLADAGLGFKCWVSGKFALRADVRDVMFFDRTFHNLSATAGFVFGKGRSAPFRPLLRKRPHRLLCLLLRPLLRLRPRPKNRNLSPWKRFILISTVRV